MIVTIMQRRYKQFKTYIMEIILCAAIWYKQIEPRAAHRPINTPGGVVLCGHRHGHRFENMYDNKIEFRQAIQEIWHTAVNECVKRAKMNVPQSVVSQIIEKVKQMIK